MESNQKSAFKSDFNFIGKYKEFRTQLQIVYNYLYENIATATMVTNATGVPQKNVTRFKRELEKAGLLREVERKLCKSSGFSAWYLTTNPELFPLINEPSNTDKL